MRSIFVNLPVKDIEASRLFFAALGFSFNPAFSDESTACMIVEENIFVMLLAEARFCEFLNGPISDAHKATEVLTCLSANSREEVDDILAKALAARATPWKAVTDHGFMVACSFQDLDGHVWEVVWMDPAAAPPA